MVHHGERFHPEAAGCLVTEKDISIVIGSITCCLTYFIYGASKISLSAAVPQLADSLNASTASFGIAYTARGLGFLTGTLITSYLFQASWFKLPKTLTVCCALVLSGLMLLLVGFSDSYSAVVGLFFIQGVCFGGVVMTSNCAIIEFWGNHAQPWMQSLQLSYSAGAVSAPLFVGSIPYRLAFTIVAICSLAPIGTLFLGYVYDAREAHTARKLKTLQENNQRATLNYNMIAGIDDNNKSVIGVDKMPTIIEEGGVQGDINSKVVTPDDNSSKSVLSTVSGDEPASIINSNKNDICEVNFHSADNRENEIVIFDAETHSIRPRADSGMSLNFSPQTLLSTIPSFHESLNIEMINKMSTKSVSMRGVGGSSGSTRSGRNRKRSTSRALKMNNAVIPIPFTVKCLAGLFFFLYMGIANAYPAWVAIYALNTRVAKSDASAAYLISIFMGSVALGRVLTIISAIRVSTTKILRIQLISLMLSGVVLVCISEISYAALAVASALIGVSISGSFGLAMTVLTDYGFTMNPLTTTLFMVGTNVGESTLPLAIGYLMADTGDASFVYIMLCIAVAMACVYATIHIVSTHGDFDEGDNEEGTTNGTDMLDNMQCNDNHQIVGGVGQTNSMSVGISGVERDDADLSESEANIENQV